MKEGEEHLLARLAEGGGEGGREEGGREVVQEGSKGGEGGGKGRGGGGGGGEGGFFKGGKGLLEMLLGPSHGKVAGGVGEEEEGAGGEVVQALDVSLVSVKFKGVSSSGLGGEGPF